MHKEVANASLLEDISFDFPHSI